MMEGPYAEQQGVHQQGGPPGLAWAPLNWTDAVPVDCDATVPTSPAFQVAVYLMYSSVFVVALVGNGLVMYCVVSSPRMRTSTNYWLLNLAVGDILMTLLCVPFSFVPTLLLQYWPFGVELCHLVSFCQTVSVLVSAYTLVAISVDRYLAIMWPLRPRLSGRLSQGAMLLVWVFAILTALPIPMVTRLTQPDSWHAHCGKWVCLEDWPSPLYRHYYTLALMSLQYFAPLAVLLYTYTRIAVVIWGKRTPGEAENLRDQRLAKAKRKEAERCPEEKKDDGRDELWWERGTQAGTRDR
ncbi:RYamide receptor-like [Frankliniella occidentalis]|uniref:RYamide receptor-like n=1 Tax=Frankliniella occidentalis TaxID=133901 RepID=A0A9C6U4V2_FRAOC|nr:RYamide receptor-like [Frankliniella occidentalis]